MHNLSVSIDPPGPDLMQIQRFHWRTAAQQACTRRQKTTSVHKEAENPDLGEGYNGVLAIEEVDFRAKKQSSQV